MADATEPSSEIQGRRRSASRDPKVFVLLRELSEVHLLLDNVSASPATTVSERAPVARPRDLDKDWIEKVCEISWPPDGSNEDKAEDAALLIRAKDHLNRLSSPASGATIAFTLLVTQGGAKKGWWRGKSGDEASPTRNSLAQIAYPDLIGKAMGFRKAIWWISVGLVTALIMTCALSWYVAYGNAALAELATTRTALVQAQERVTEAADSNPAPSGAAVSLAPTPPAVQARPVTPAGAVRPAASGAVPAEARAAAPPAKPAPSRAFANYCAAGQYASQAQAQQCAVLNAAEQDLTLVEQRLASWTCWRLSGDCQGEEPHDPGTNDVPSHAATLANILGSAVLPFLYGLLGAGAAIIRSLSRKIRASTLSPRDLHLSFQQLALGAVVGACIGLFIAAPTDGSGDGLLGPVALSGSAISFVAGFGVEAVFQALEALITRIFNIAPAAAATRGGPPPRG